MRVNSISNVSFGKISASAINVVRRQAEGYLFVSHSYLADPAYKMMDEKQLNRLEALTIRASKLDKSMITQTAVYKNSHNCHYSDDSISVIADVDNNTKKEFRNLTRVYNLKDKTPDECLDELEKAVQYAEKIEQTDSIPVFDKHHAYGRDIIGYYNGDKDKFRTDEDIKILSSIYANTVH